MTSPQHLDAAKYWVTTRTVREGLDAMISPHDDALKKHETMRGLFLRSWAWLGTVERLSDPSHHQALLAGARSTLETAVDMTLLDADTSGDSFAKLLDWERSAKLKAAERSLEYARINGKPRNASQLNFVQANALAVANMRRSRQWTVQRKAQIKPKHPDRWTNQDLYADCRGADSLVDAEMKDICRFEFEFIYATLFDTMCWSTHGSGLVAARGMGGEVFHGYAFFSYALVQQFTLYCGVLLMRHAGLMDAARAALIPLLELRKTIIDAMETAANA